MPAFRVSLQLGLALAAACTRPAPESGAPSGAAQVGIQRIASAPTTRRLAIGTFVDIEGRPSPDGRYFSITDWSTGDLALRDLHTGATIRLTKTATWATPIAFAEASVMAPDAKRIAYGWFDERKMRFELRAMSLAGADSGVERVVMESPDLEYASPQVFTPDSKNVVVQVTRTGGTTQILLVPVADCVDCKPRALKSFDWRYPYDIAVSPDGRWVAYDFPPVQERSERDVYLLALDGSRETVVAKHSAQDVVVGWTKDGSHLLIGSERGGTMSVYGVPVVDGKQRGEPILVRADMWGLVPVGGTRDGSIMYAVSVGQPELFTAVVDPKTGVAVSSPASATASLRTRIGLSFAFSADGHYLAFTTNRGSVRLGSARDIVVRSVDRGDTRRFSPALAAIISVSWFPDGRSLLLVGRDDKGRVGLFRMSLESGALSTMLLDSRKGYPRGAAISPDAQRVFFVHNAATGETVIEVFDTINGGVRELYRSKEGPTNWLALSPDGGQIAFFTRTPAGGYIANVLSTDGGPAREVFRFPTGMRPYPLVVSWSPDMRELLFATTKDPTDSASATVGELRRIVLATGEIRSTGISLRGLGHARLSSDGRRVALLVQSLTTELWVMDPPKFDSARSIKADER